MRKPIRLTLATGAAALLAFGLSGVASAHVLKNFGTYSVALGWAKEPTYVGVPNAVQVIVKDASGKPVTDLADGDLKVVVSLASQSSAALTLANAFDSDTGLGVQGDYEASITPTVVGDYTFHLTGSIHGTAVDETATSSDSTFNSVVDQTDVQFPVKVPSLTDIVTRLDRIDARLSASPSAAPSAAASASAAPSASAAAGGGAGASAAPSGGTGSGSGSDPATIAAQAHDTATNALLIAVGLGIVAVLLAVVALGVSLRQRRPAGA
jgi:hypothetical protein